ncbi:MAG: hypothetical protein ACO24S_07475 [Ilumatobacteraceae bacterium]
MTLSTAQYSIGTTVTEIVKPQANPQMVYIHNNENAQQVYIGGSNVTTSNGVHVDGKEDHSFVLNPGESLYCVSSNTSSISVMTQVL